MEINEYQKLALRTAKGIVETQEDKLINGVMGLAGESGEVIDLIKKWKYQGHHLDKDHLAEEIGDVCWYIALLADGIGIELEEILQQNIDKLKKRYPDGFRTEKSINRE